MECLSPCRITTITLGKGVRIISEIVTPDRFLQSLSPSLEHDRHRGNFCGSAPGRNFKLSAINLLTSFLLSPKAAPGAVAIRNWIGAWPCNVFLQPKTCNCTYCPASGLGSFGFFSKTWIFGSDSTKPSEVDSPILPPIAATH